MSTTTLLAFAERGIASSEAASKRLRRFLA
jgi:hypothetical protein